MSRICSYRFYRLATCGVLLVSLLPLPANAAFSGDVTRVVCGTAMTELSGPYWIKDDTCTIAQDPGKFNYSPVWPLYRYAYYNIPTERFGSAKTLTASMEVKGGNGTSGTQPAVCSWLEEYDDLGNYVGGTSAVCTYYYGWYNQVRTITLQPLATVVVIVAAQDGNAMANTSKVATVSISWDMNGS